MTPILAACQSRPWVAAVRSLNVMLEQRLKAVSRATTSDVESSDRSAAVLETRCRWCPSRRHGYESTSSSDNHIGSPFVISYISRGTGPKRIARYVAPKIG